ncbi:hypothetical protein I547_3336 [Mycobacterium kansasii 824]|nr:hypothetical protein I547_3336 [Mycobacterium kansasii 824]
MVGKGRNDLVFADTPAGCCVTPNGARVFTGVVTKCQKADESFPSITPHDARTPPRAWR